MAIYTKEEQFKLIEESYFNLKDIDNQYEEVCLEAVKQNIKAIKFAKKLPKKNALEIIKQDFFI